MTCCDAECCPSCKKRPQSGRLCLQQNVMQKKIETLKQECVEHLWETPSTVSTFSWLQVPPSCSSYEPGSSSPPKPQLSWRCLGGSQSQTQRDKRCWVCRYSAHRWQQSWPPPCSLGPDCSDEEVIVKGRETKINKHKANATRNDTRKSKTY